jgi:cyclase
VQGAEAIKVPHALSPARPSPVLLLSLSLYCGPGLTFEVGFSFVEESPVFTEEAPGVFSVASRFVDGKNGVIVGRGGALAIDCSNYVDEGQAMADFIRERGYESNDIVLTHGHGDHIYGAVPLMSGQIYGHALTGPKIASQLPMIAEKWDCSEQAASDRLPWPTISYRDELWIDLGDKHLWMFPTPGHSNDGVSVYVEEDKLLFSGDSVVNGIVSAIGDGDSAILESSLGRLLELDIEILVPGHGFTIRGRDKIEDWLTWQIHYLTSVRAKVREGLEKGLGPTAAAESIDYDTYIGERLPIDRNGMPKRHRNTVDKIVEEESTMI